MECRCGDGRLWLADDTRRWDVVYLDPMFPARRKRALPNRGLQHLQVLAAEYPVDLEECLAQARSRAGRRVVVKRRLRDPKLGRPSHQLKGHAVRFDVYA